MDYSESAKTLQRHFNDVTDETDELLMRVFDLLFAYQKYSFAMRSCNRELYVTRPIRAVLVLYRSFPKRITSEAFIRWVDALPQDMLADAPHVLALNAWIRALVLNVVIRRHESLNQMEVQDVYASTPS